MLFEGVRIVFKAFLIFEAFLSDSYPFLKTFLQVKKRIDFIASAGREKPWYKTAKKELPAAP